MAFNIFALSIVILQSSFIAHITTARSVCIVQWAAVGIRYQKCYSSLNDSDFSSLSFGCFQHAHKIYIDLISPRTNSLMFRFFSICSHCVEQFCRYYGLIFSNGSKWILFLSFFSYYFSELLLSIDSLLCISIFKTCTYTIHLCGGGGVCRSAPNNDNDDFQFVQWKKCLFFLVFFHYSLF